MKTLRNFFSILDGHTLAIVLLSCTATYSCIAFGISASLPTALIGIAVVFPMVFSINSAYRRREEGLKYYASIKGHLVALYYTARDWSSDKVRNKNEFQPEMKELARATLATLDECLSSKEKSPQQFDAVYSSFSNISQLFERLREAGLAGGEISRANQYLKNIMVEFERMRNISMYRTPLSLRAYSKVFLNAFPVLFAPHFAYLSAEYWMFSGFIVAATYSLVLISLDNIQELLEDPFDRLGIDDVNLDVFDAYDRTFSN